MKNHGDVAIENKSSIIKYLRRSGVCSRAQIAQAVGLTQASISKIIAQLKSEGIVFETGFIAGAKGRRSVGVALNTMCKRVLGVRLSRRSFAVGLFDLSGKMYENVLTRYEDIAAIGVAVPGPFNVKTAEIALTTSMATSDWTNVRLREEFGEDLPVKVVFCHDAIAGALANWWFGSKVDNFRSSLVHFLVGDGVGAGFIENGEVHENAMGFSTEMGHVSVDVDGPLCACGNRGCLELYFRRCEPKTGPARRGRLCFGQAERRYSTGCIHSGGSGRPFGYGGRGPGGQVYWLWGGELDQYLCPGRGGC